MCSIDGFLDVVEIKKPNSQFWVGSNSNDILCQLSAELTEAITQCLNYLYRIEQQSDSIKFQKNLLVTKTLKPKCLLVYGHSNNWNDNDKKSLRFLNSLYNQLHIVTYDQILTSAKFLLRIKVN